VHLVDETVDDAVHGELLGLDMAAVARSPEEALDPGA
jgi:hypothetical protein